MKHIKRTETEKTEKKRALFLQGAFILSLDSLTGEILNPEFKAIDHDLFTEVYSELQKIKEQEQAETEHLLNTLKVSGKVCLNDIRGF